MMDKQKKTIMYFGIVIIVLGLFILWRFQFKLNLEKTKNKDEFFSNLKNIYEQTSETYKSIELKKLIESEENNGININQLKDKILREYVKKSIQEKKGDN